MRIYVTITFIFLSLGITANDDFFKGRMGTAITELTLYTDSSHLKPSNVYFKEGQLFEVIAESQLEHEDNAQNQKFKWFKVQTAEGHEGWVFGDAMAVISPDERVEALFKPYHKKKKRFNNGFEVSRVWVASIDGRDNFHAQDFMNPIYSEQYLVITNEQGKSVHIKCGGVSARGETQIKEFEFKDLTGDHVSEMILLSSSISQESAVENRNISIYSFQAGTLEKVFDERMTLSYSESEPSPALYKHVELDEQSVRVEYVDYVKCAAYSLPFKFDVKNSKRERCLEYVTYTYIWDDRVNQFRVLYEESRSSPIAGVKTVGLALQKEPKLSAARGAIIDPEQPIEVIKHFEKFVLERGKKKLECYLYVHVGAGQYGYLPAKFVGFVESEHAQLLNAYYADTPIARSEWKSEDKFFKIVETVVDSANTDR